MVFPQLTVLLARMEETVHREPASVRAVIPVIRASGVSKVCDLRRLYSHTQEKLFLCVRHVLLKLHFVCVYVM